MALISLGFLGPVVLPAIEVRAQSGDMLIDDFTSRDFASRLGMQWRAGSDQVMVGISEASVTLTSSMVVDACVSRAMSGSRTTVVSSKQRWSRYARVISSMPPTTQVCVSRRVAIGRSIRFTCAHRTTSVLGNPTGFILP